MSDQSENQKAQRSWVEEIEIASEKLVEFIKDLAADASVRKVRVRSDDGEISVELPLTVGAVAGGAVVLAAPILAVLGVLAAFAAKLKVEVVRESNAAEDDEVEAEATT